MIIERLWQHDETGNMVWQVRAPSKRWHTVPIMPEDELPDMSDADYAAWYRHSHVPGNVGCRFGPQIGERK